MQRPPSAEHAPTTASTWGATAMPQTCVAHSPAAAARRTEVGATSVAAPARSESAAAAAERTSPRLRRLSSCRSKRVQATSNATLVPQRCAITSQSGRHIWMRSAILCGAHQALRVALQAANRADAGSEKARRSFRRAHRPDQTTQPLAPRPQAPTEHAPTSFTPCPALVAAPMCTCTVHSASAAAKEVGPVFAAPASPATTARPRGA